MWVSGYIRGVVSNASVGNASSAQFVQNSTGDAAISFLIGATTEWLAGVDNSDSDSFKINAITGGGDFTGTGITLTTSGDLIVGDTSTGRRFKTKFNSNTVYSTSDFETTSLQCYIANTSSTIGAYTGIQFAVGNNGDAAISAIRTADGEAALAFGTRGSGSRLERARIDSSGNLRVGTTTGPASAKLVVAGGLSVNNNTDDATSVASYGNFFAKTTTVSPSVTTTIKNAIGSEAAMYLVSGSYAGASIRFFDIVVTMGTGLTPVVVSSGGINSPPARTYSNTSEQLGINFGGANTFIVLVTGMGSNEAS